jgi:CPA2 family monovalent cation:H+ antiporter-2
MAGPVIELREATVFLAAAGVVVPVMRSLRLSPVLGFLVVGLLIGPHGLGRFTEDLPWLSYIVIRPEAVTLAAELGVVALLFMIGLELSFARVWQLRGQVFGLGGAQVVVTATVIGLIASAFGNSREASIVLGLCLALSSTAMVMGLLSARGRLATPAGQAAFSVLLMQDLAVVPVLVLVGVLASGGDSLAQALGLAALKAAVVVTALVVGGLGVVRPVLRQVADTHSRELFLAAVLLLLIGTAWVTQMAGLSLALGAFLAGLMLAETEYRHRIAVDLEPFKGLLLGVFFLSVGLGIDLAQVATNPLWIPASVVGLIGIKAFILYVLARLSGKSHGAAAEVGLLLGQGGEFAFVVVGLALSLGLLPGPTAQFMLLVVGLSMLVTPALATLAERVGAGFEPSLRGASDGRGNPMAGVSEGGLPGGAGGAPEGASADLAGHVVIVGFGRVGRAVASLLDAQRVAWLALDSSAQTVASLRAEGLPVHHGSADSVELLRRLGVARASALVVTMDGLGPTEAVVRAVRAAYPALPIYARARDEAAALTIAALGVAQVVPETREASLQLGEAVLIGVGLPEDVAHQIVAARREEADIALKQTAG